MCRSHATQLYSQVTSYLVTKQFCIPLLKESNINEYTLYKDAANFATSNTMVVVYRAASLFISLFLVAFKHWLG